jgi:glycosyltransferase involved in cell wall biosynthesis
MNRPETDRVKENGRSRSFADPVMPFLSVMLPTYNRVEALQRTLTALEQQQGCDPKQYEIIVVDDGSSDGTAAALHGFSRATSARFSYAVLAENGGPARARNVGLSLCQSRAVLIIGDDIEPAPDLLAKHLLFHRQHPADEDALLGHVSFAREMEITGFMRWLEQDGRKYFFNYAALKAGQEAAPIFFYTCNVSVKMALLAKSGWFDQSFPYASHEDLELGCRLADQGMRLIYDPGAEGYHWHTLTVQGIARRVYLMGYSAVLFWNLVGQQGSMLRQTARTLLTLFCAAPWGVWCWNRLRRKEYANGNSYPFQWRLLLFLGFFIGLADGRRKRNIRV